MTQSTRSFLARTLVERYARLRNRLATHLGSPDLATEALHDTWLRLHSSATELEPVTNPDSYLFRAALNSAAKLSATERRVAAADIESILDLADEAPDPERVAVAKGEVAALKRTLASMSRRQRAIFLESYAGDTTHAELAERYGVSIRTIQSELRTALLHVAARYLEKDAFAKQSLKVSRKR